jgi:hypothetical protein
MTGFELGSFNAAVVATNEQGPLFMALGRIKVLPHQGEGLLQIHFSRRGQFWYLTITNFLEFRFQLPQQGRPGNLRLRPQGGTKFNGLVGATAGNGRLIVVLIEQGLGGGFRLRRSFHFIGGVVNDLEHGIAKGAAVGSSGFLGAVAGIVFLNR